MKDFFGKDIFLDNETAKELYNCVKDLPIFDYHCHLSPKEIAEDRVFHDLGELWLECDHYKWRLMRFAGVEERLVTGDAPYKDKFFAFAKAVEGAVGNPVYHWIHFELNRYFGINAPLSSDTCEEIWNKTKEMMKDGSFSARKLIKKSNVEAIFTTDDPADALEYHEKLKKDFDVRVSPTFRPDVAVCGINRPDFPSYIEKLGKAAGMKIDSFVSLSEALARRLGFFKYMSCACADISFTSLPDSDFDPLAAEAAFSKRMSGSKVTKEEADVYSFTLFSILSGNYANLGITSQIHLGALRNNYSELFENVGPDSGNDSVGKPVDVEAFGRLLDNISPDMPKTIVYTLNPSPYYELATMIGNFWGSNGGKLQLGAAWWFCDHRDGIKEQLKIFSDTASLGSFNGMLTDSRSFTSYARHDYFRRVLCSFVGKKVESGEYPLEAAKKVVRDVSIENARKQFS